MTVEGLDDSSLHIVDLVEAVDIRSFVGLEYIMSKVGFWAFGVNINSRVAGWLY